MPYSGPASAWATVGKAEAAYFRLINDMGGGDDRAAALRCDPDRLAWMHPSG
jgi:branched-chain amino acid transport system substrate-binding protein